MTEFLQSRSDAWLPRAAIGPKGAGEPPLPVVLIAGHPIVRSGLVRTLADSPDLSLVGDAASVEQARGLIAEMEPAAILFVPNGADEMGLLSALSAETEVPVVLIYQSTNESDPDLAGRLPADATPRQISAALHAVAAGLAVTTARTKDALPADQEEPASEDPLTDREMQVLQLVAGGLPNKGIARRLGISEHTVKFHVGSILGKLGAASRTEAVTLAAHRGLLTL